MNKYHNPIYTLFIILVIAFVSLSYLHGMIKITASEGFGDFANYYFFAKALSHNYIIYTLDTPLKDQLKKEFGNNYDSYEAYFMNDKEFQAAGNVTCFDSKKVALFPKPTATQTAKEIWDSDPQLRTEFNHNFKAYELYVRS